jgi:hypothetical protein
LRASTTGTWSLVQKPAAFSRYVYRDELFPSLVFRRAYDAIQSHHGTSADLEYLRILFLAARRGVKVTRFVIPEGESRRERRTAVARTPPSGTSKVRRRRPTL